jgi:transcriptional regulator with XRE-family HTH domain
MVSRPIRRNKRTDRKGGSTARARSKDKGVAGSVAGEESGLDHSNVERRIGAALRRHRTKAGLTIAELAVGAGISQAMLSRIETGAAAATLETLMRLSKTLGVAVSTLFREIEEISGHAQVIKRGKAMEVVRSGTKKGFTYRLLAYHQGPAKHFEPFLISMGGGSKVYPEFEHPGTEFMYILEGRLQYRHGDKVYTLEPGDAMTFSGQVPHGPVKLMDGEAKFIDIIVYGPGEAP